MTNLVAGHSIDQGLAAYIDYLNHLRLTDLMATLEAIFQAEESHLAELVARQRDALTELDWAKDEIVNLVQHQRGGARGVHGFIAEVLETGIRNARSLYQGLGRVALLLNDNGPVDINLHGEDIQMKFYANLLNELQQSSHYDQMMMMFPKDHVEVIHEIMAGAKVVELNGQVLTLNKIHTIRKVIEEESVRRGVPYDKWLTSSVLRYQEVQQGAVAQTLSGEAEAIRQDSLRQEASIKAEASQARDQAKELAKANFNEAHQVAGVGAAVQGGVNLALFIYQKNKEGKPVWEFGVEDWKACGLTTAAGALKGGISGYAIYGLTNCCHLAAPSAGAVTSGTFGLLNALLRYRTGQVDADGFIDLITLNAVDATGAAIGAALGQAVIPIPVLGAVIGSIIANTALSFGKGFLNQKEQELIDNYQHQLETFTSTLDKAYQDQLAGLLEAYHQLGKLQDIAFDTKLNTHLRLQASITLAKSVGVLENNLLKNDREIDTYFLA